jgi:hypothetical protein
LTERAVAAHGRQGTSTLRADTPHRGTIPRP